MSILYTYGHVRHEKRRRWVAVVSTINRLPQVGQKVVHMVLIGSAMRSAPHAHPAPFRVALEPGTSWNRKARERKWQVFVKTSKIRYSFT